MGEVSLKNVRYDAANGTFEVRDVASGTYSVTATDPSLAMGTTPVIVAAADVDGIVLPLVPAGTLTGRVRGEGKPFFFLEPVGVLREPLELVYVRMGFGGVQFGQTNADGSLSFMRVVRGEYRLSVGGEPAQGGRPYIKEARFEGADVLNSPMRYSGTGNAVLDLEVALGRGQIQGVVRDARAQPVGGALVVAVPERTRHRVDLYRVGYADKSGRFAVTGIAPGDYTVFSFEALEDNAWLAPEVVARYEGRGRSVRVGDGASEAMELSVIPE
jgi:hypothetical protein